jgi:hypothetical protein
VLPGPGARGAGAHVEGGRRDVGGGLQQVLGVGREQEDGLSAGTLDRSSGPHCDCAVTSRQPLRSRAAASSNSTDDRGRTSDA